MNLRRALTRLAAAAIHDVRAELQQMNTPAQQPHRYDPASTTAATTERAYDQEPGRAAAVGFGLPGQPGRPRS